MPAPVDLERLKHFSDGTGEGVRGDVWLFLERCLHDGSTGERNRMPIVDDHPMLANGRGELENV